MWQKIKNISLVCFFVKIIPLKRDREDNFSVEHLFYPGMWHAAYETEQYETVLG